ncbi:MAG: acetyl-CoA carboxylase, carboxyltransferase subunit beta, partial [Clostridiales bacterium]|nr:acetyl-CoA carboxylase, carboxyltransferase subunit beta [Clostridiales bacterium]
MKNTNGLTFRKPVSEKVTRVAEMELRLDVEEGKNSSGRKKEKQPEVPDGMFRKCDGCGKIVYEKEVEANRYICPKCGKYYRVSPQKRLRLVTDADSFREWDGDVEETNPLQFPDYEEKLKTTREKTGLSDAVLTGEADIRGTHTAIGIMSPEFMMGSMGTVVGERITRLVERATRERLPLVLFCCSGGARMQEGILSLMQMEKVSQALKRFDQAGLLYISVLTDPTMGGVTASFAMLGDVILAEPGAMIGFAGARVIRQTIGQKLPEGFQSAEFLQSHGFVDRIVRREHMRKTLHFLLEAGKASAKEGKDCPAEEDAWNGKAPQAESQKKEEAFQPEEGDLFTGEEDSRPENPPEEESPSGNVRSSQAGPEEAVSAWERVCAARSLDRPASMDYVQEIFDMFVELRGDRYYGDDRAVLGGFARLDGSYMMVICQQKGRSAAENTHRNFGMPSPEGYRKALRLSRLAEKLRLPILMLVDTPGAFCGIEAEERGQGEAIARNLFELSGIRVPILSVVIG